MTADSSRTVEAAIDRGPARNLRVLAVQTGPAGLDVEANLASSAALAVEADGDDTTADLIVFPELFSRPFWCLGDSDPSRFDWAETFEGPTVTAATALARRTSATVITPFFERGSVPGEFYNSAAVVGPGGPIAGRLPDGRAVNCYRKNAISAFRWGDEVNDEKFYFRPGPGFAVFDTPKARVGVLICLDRWFPEAWRVLALAGAEVVCVVNASQGAVGELFVPSMRTCAAQNVVFAVAVNKVDTEHLGERSVAYYGQTCVIDPYGAVVAQTGGDGPAAVSATIDLNAVSAARVERTMYRDRRPELYQSLVEDGR